ncbi:DUF6197 family protein [Dyella sp.]|uniref:DUF6197 family protein n=1 Tax=Dyella sp. TaxID=1869338 RepID=UPI002D7A3E29|nr:hypothetical protein [Dyella sp.]HET6433676.1 hypothetical protein [Dyella sp.]
MSFIREHHWRRGISWFLAEFVVVVAGVLVALAVSAWWQGRLDRENENEYLQQLDADLLATENDMEHAQAVLNKRALAAHVITHAFWGERPANEAELLRDLGAPWRSARYRPVLGNIEALIATGDIHVIRAAALRTELVAYDEWAKARLEDISRYDETYYRPGINALLTRADPASANVDAYRKRLAGRPHAFDLTPAAATGSAPFPMDLTALFKDRVVYNAYMQIGLAHRNQAAEYGLILERARHLHAEVYQALHGVAEPGNCQLVRRGNSDDFVGSCGSAFAAASGADGELTLTLHPVAAIGSGRWKRDDLPADVWAGGMTTRSPGEAAIELESSILKEGVLRTQLGWFRVHGVEQDQDYTRDQGSSRLSFRLDTRSEVPPNAMDVAILRKAKALLADASRWDREDDRQCTPAKTMLSLYCAMQQASISESGGFQHRRPALQIVRRLVDERSVGRDYSHRMRDYNNDPRTSLTDLQTLFDEAIARAQRPRAEQGASDVEP